MLIGNNWMSWKQLSRKAKARMSGDSTHWILRRTTSWIGWLCRSDIQDLKKILEYRFIGNLPLFISSIPQLLSIQLIEQKWFSKEDY